LQGIPDAILRAAVILFLIIQRMLLHVLIVELRRPFADYKGNRKRFTRS